MLVFFEHSPLCIPCQYEGRWFLEHRTQCARPCLQDVALAVARSVSHWGFFGRLRVRRSVNDGGIVIPHSMSPLESLVCISDCALPINMAACSLIERASCFFFFFKTVWTGHRTWDWESSTSPKAHGLSWLLSRMTVIREVWDPQRFRAGTSKRPDAEDPGNVVARECD